MVSSDVMIQAGITPEEDISDAETDQIDEEMLQDIEEQDLDVFEDFLKNFDVNDLPSDQDIDEEDQDWSSGNQIKVIINRDTSVTLKPRFFVQKFILANKLS